MCVGGEWIGGWVHECVGACVRAFVHACVCVGCVFAQLSLRHLSI